MADSPRPKPIDVRPIAAAQACLVRAEVLRPHWNPVQCSFPMDDDPRTLHLGGFVEGELAGVASFIAEAHPQLTQEIGLAPYPQYFFKLRGMATREAYQGQGIGSAVLSEGLFELRLRGVRALWCNARISAHRFYLMHGFQDWGEEFDNPPVGPHIVMWTQLRLTEDEVGRLKDVLLAMQMALTMEIGPALRAVMVRWTPDSLKFRAYFHGEISDSDEDSMSCVEGELVARFPESHRIFHEAIRLDHPAVVPKDNGWTCVFHRREY
jgi:GNAT superfamily N-acetyltransferase